MSAIYSLILILPAWLIYLARNRTASPLILWLCVWSVAFLFLASLGDAFYYPRAVEHTIFAYVATFSITCALAGGLSKTKRSQNRITGSASLLYFIFATQMCGILSFAFLASSLGFRASTITNLVEFTGAAQRNQVAIYNNWSLTEDGIPLITKIFNAIFQSGFIIYFFYRGAGWRPSGYAALYPIIAFLTALSFSAITTVRIFFLVPAILSVASFLAGAAYNAREQELFRPRYVIAAISILFSLLFLTILFQTVRLGDRTYGLEYTLNHMRPWVAGYIPAFGLWLSEPSQSNTFGQLFLRGILAPMGLAQGEGLTERLELISLGNGQTTNASTLFRVVVGDWGKLGAVLFTALLGVISGICYRATKNGSPLGATFLVGVIAAILWSPNYWFFGYGSRVLAISLALIVLPRLLYLEKAD